MDTIIQRFHWFAGITILALIGLLVVLGFSRIEWLDMVLGIALAILGWFAGVNGGIAATLMKFDNINKDEGND
ncbi:MAG TPA: hypothetical protein EYF95_00250 [Flavobacteriales bacterium]|nr:hypothetical protein [Flavobacteriales bacterium]